MWPNAEWDVTDWLWTHGKLPPFHTREVLKGAAAQSRLLCWWCGFQWLSAEAVRCNNSGLCCLSTGYLTTDSQRFIYLFIVCFSFLFSFALLSFNWSIINELQCSEENVVWEAHDIDRPLQTSEHIIKGLMLLKYTCTWWPHVAGISLIFNVHWSVPHRFQCKTVMNCFLTNRKCFKLYHHSNVTVSIILMDKDGTGAQ